MANFTALNIEPDDQSDDEVDNTKELQIEDALKLYQTALKLHSQGQFPGAAEAYTNLFKSEVFKYPESITEFARLEQHPESENADPTLVLDLEFAAAAAADGAPSTLPQILFLSYKNHGQFILDCVKGRVKHEPMEETQLDYQAKAAIHNFSLAIASDESDAELWRRAARIGLMLGSKRISRYCLEAAVELDDDPTISEVEPPSLEEAFAGEQLKEQLEILSDETSLSHPIMGPFMKKTIPEFLIAHIDPYPFLPKRKNSLGNPEENEQHKEAVPEGSRTILNVDARTWTAIGNELCAVFTSPEGPSGKAITIQLPEQEMQSTEVQTAQIAGASEDQIMKDVGVMESPTAESSETAAVTPAPPKDDDPQVEVITTTTTVPLSDGPRRQSSTALPTRKRSQSAAGLRETPEDDNNTQKRSKRIRRRDTNEGPIDPTTQYAEQLKDCVRADEDVFAFVGGLLTKLGVEDLGTFSELREILDKDQLADSQERTANTAVKDLNDILRTWDEAKASTFVNANAADILGSSASAGNANAGLAAFLEHSKSGPLKVSSIPPFSDTDNLMDFISKVDAEAAPLQDVVYEWIRIILQTYRTTIWPEALKVSVVRIISFADAEIFTRLQKEIDQTRQAADSASLPRFEELVETLFELHLDIYSRITNPSSIVNYETRIMTKDRLDRWADFAADTITLRNGADDDELTIRYLWASVFYATQAENVSREHKVLCWSDLQSLLREADKDTIELQNNAVMPEISVTAAEREVSRLTTMDFFFNLFQTDRSDPLAIIETLEPVLDPESAYEALEPAADDSTISVEAQDGTPAALRDMWKFLKTGSISLRLFLWQRLKEAYASIGYNTKVFSCHLKCIEIIVADLRSDDFVDSADDPRRHKLLIWLKALDDLLVKSLTTALNDADTCFEIIDDRHLRSTSSAVAQLSRVLHTAALFDDETRVGMTQLPHNSAQAQSSSFNSFMNKLREMQVRAWALQYTLVKEAISQNMELFPTPENDLADFLALVHYVLGLRKFCKSSNKIFLKMMKVEIMQLKDVDRWEDYLGQVLYDLYGLKLGVGTYLLDEHGCPTENIDRRTVLNIADQVIVLANRLSIKDLLKHELRSTIEKMQTAVGQNKTSPQMTHNLRNITEYLKTSIRPINFMRAWKGQLMVDSIPVLTPESPLADKGWYFLLGMIALTRFRTQKRLGPGAQTDDLKVGATFLRLQLQFNGDQWETWFRLAQCFDYELEEEVLWSSDKINNHRSDLVRLQRSSVHCYVMALSTSVRNADASLETAGKLSEMYYDFGLRIYASSREPFTMEAFWVDDFEKHMSGSQGMYKKALHGELTRYMAWSYAARLFREALKDRPKNWMSHFMLGKCLWKMYRKPADDIEPRLRANKPTMDSVLKAFTRAIETCPKPRDGRQEPIIEPHYKLVSIVHKLVSAGAMPPQAGAELLSKQPYGANKGETLTVNGPDDWEPFILGQLRHLRSVDKQHWQHRMVARVANILYDGQHPNYTQATAARHEFKESIFTKTMQVQVWKPEAERAGRHCVYMERYVLLMINLLWITGDKTSMEALAKRIRKKPTEFLRFTQVWNECCSVYLRLIRRAADIQPSMDDVFRNVPLEEFEVLSERLAAWMADPAVSHPVLDALRETSELKKLNANLMKATPIDDLINDAWGTLYTQVAKTLPGPPPPTSAPQPQPASDPSQPPPPPARSAASMSLTNLVMDINGTQVPIPVTFAPTEANRPRKIGVSRREVLRHAEMAVNRGPDASRATAPNASSSRARQEEPSSAMISGSSTGPGRASGKGRSMSMSANGVGTTTNERAKNTEGEHKNTSEAGSEGGEDGRENENDNDNENENEDNGDQDQDQDHEHDHDHDHDVEAEEGEEGGEEGEEEEDQEGEDDEEDADVDAGNDEARDADDESERGSLHDSADDESDLSDVPDMEDVDEASVFPDMAGGASED